MTGGAGNDEWPTPPSIWYRARLRDVRAAALLNMTGFGAGYFYLRLLPRGAVALGGTDRECEAGNGHAAGGLVRNRSAVVGRLRRPAPRRNVAPVLRHRLHALHLRVEEHLRPLIITPV